MSLAIAPTSVSDGRPGSAAGGAGGAGAAIGVATTSGAGARRDGTNSGRSRVAVSRDSGIAQSGLALGSNGFATGWLGRALTVNGSKGVALSTAVPLVLRGSASVAVETQ